MLDCLSKGRLISGFARGIPREYQVHNVPLAESRARFEEAYDIITRAWTEEVFSYEGQYWSYHDVALWPRPVQQPHPPIWMPIVGSQESIEFAAAHNIPITPGLGRARGLRDDIIRFYATCLAKAGHRITPDHLSLGMHPPQIFLSACGFALIAAIATALLAFRGQRAPVLTPQEAAE